MTLRVPTWRRLACLWYGHTDILQAEPIRLRLHCTSCGRETPGWTLDTPQPVRRHWKLLRFKSRLLRFKKRVAA